MGIEVAGVEVEWPPVADDDGTRSNGTDIAHSGDNGGGVVGAAAARQASGCMWWTGGVGVQLFSKFLSSSLFLGYCSQPRLFRHCYATRLVPGLAYLLASLGQPRVCCVWRW